ncbi:MAG: phosphoesterase RecJ-like protein [Candidatus Krumholzibacteriia bacterium]|jgi:phosphoesterase RecJ-like protein
MDPYRTNKMNQAILEVLSQLITTSVKDPRVGFVTINQVKLNRDHSVAEIFYSVMGDDPEEQKKSFVGLKKARGYMQSKLVRVLGLRAAPNLRFVYDHTVATAIGMGELLDSIKDDGGLMTEEEKKREMSLVDLQPTHELMMGLQEGKSFWIVPHHNPDPDALGSALALGEALYAMGKHVRVMGYSDPSVGLTELPGFKDVTPHEDAEELYSAEKPDTLILVDCHHLDRCGPLEGTLERFDTQFTIDHHLVSGRKAPLPGWIEPKACSSCTLVHQVIMALIEASDDAFELTVDMGTNLFAGLVTDTGGFRFDNTMPFTFELGQKLSRLGVDTAEVNRQTLFRYRRSGVAMLQKVLETFDYYADGKILIAHATQSMLEETGALMADTEGFVNIATAIDDVRFVAFLKQRDEEEWRVSLRVCTKGDVQQVAAKHGGGGHKMAAGCTLAGPLAEVVATLVGDLTVALDN